MLPEQRGERPARSGRGYGHAAQFTHGKRKLAKRGGPDHDAKSMCSRELYSYTIHRGGTRHELRAKESHRTRGRVLGEFTQRFHRTSAPPRIPEPQLQHATVQGLGDDNPAKMLLFQRVAEGEEGRRLVGARDVRRVNAPGRVNGKQGDRHGACKVACVSCHSSAMPQEPLVSCKFGHQLAFPRPRCA